MRSNDCCTYEPVTDPAQVVQGDIVFCQVRDSMRFFAHLVKKKFWDHTNKWRFVISNITGRENGWCNIDTLFGRLILVEH